MATDPENVTFLDLACLLKIGPETTLEKFGTLINASVFDAANSSGTLKQKGLIDFTAYYPGPNSIVVTELGKKFISDVEAKSNEALDTFDEEVLRQMSGGKRFPSELATTMNVRDRDLTFRIYKLSKQGYLGYELKNGNVELRLTEQGFLKAKPAPVVQAPKAQQKPAQTQPMAQTQQMQGGMAAQSGEMEEPKPEMQVELKKPKGKTGKFLLILLLLIVILAIVVYFLSKEGYIQLPFGL